MSDSARSRNDVSASLAAGAVGMWLATSPRTVRAAHRRLAARLGWADRRGRRRSTVRGATSTNKILFWLFAGSAHR